MMHPNHKGKNLVMHIPTTTIAINIIVTSPIA